MTVARTHVRTPPKSSANDKTSLKSQKQEVVVQEPIRELLVDQLFIALYGTIDNSTFTVHVLESRE